MGEKEGHNRSEWWWAGGSAAQLGLGIWMKQNPGHPGLVPLRAFSVATLFVSSFACAAVSVVHASGIRTMEDLAKVGGNTGAMIRTGLGKTNPKPQDE